MSLNRNLGSYPGVLITASLTIALFLIGFCGWIAISSNELIKYVKQNIEVQVFLDRDIDSTKTINLENYLKNLKVADETDGTQSIKFVTKAQAAEIFFKETKENYEEVLGDNPFRDSYIIKMKADKIDEKLLQKLKMTIEKIDGVFEVEYAKDFLKGVINNVTKVYRVLTFIVVIFFLATIMLINNTIKLALYSQRFIIRTMKLVGATDRFIQKPFLLNGLTQGLVASLISIALLFLLERLASSQVEGLSLIQNTKFSIALYGILLLLGPIIGMLSTFASLNKYHKLDLDKLY